jgi:tetratricopeptide (TPR) repeat protein
MAEVEALLCEAQIAAGFTTDWDDLEMPAVDEERRMRIAARMPTARGLRGKLVIAAAAAIAVVSLGTAAYLGLRKPTVVIKEVRVELTKTEEAPEVAAALLKASEAARAEHYVRPAPESALHYIQIAEIEASRLKRPSPGAAMLRRVYASALAVIGNELLKAELTELAIAKFKEALLFQPDDAELRQKAELMPEEPKSREKRPGPAVVAAPAPADDPKDAAKDAAAHVFLAATRGRLSEARLALAPLGKIDDGGTQTARLADALRGRALVAWNGNRQEKEQARALYALVAALDPGDIQAAERAREPVPAAPSPAVVAAPPPPPPPPPPVAAKPKRRAAEVAAEPAEPDAPRDPTASQAAALLGSGALARGRLNEAETAFTRAVRADAQNPVAVGGLAEVAFERARYSDALDFARRASRLAPRTPKYATLTGDAYFKLLRYDDALRSYEKARALAPQDDEIKNRIDRVHAKVGR